MERTMNALRSVKVIAARLRPKTCAIPRMIVAFLTFAVGFPRLPIFESAQFAPLKFVSPEFYGIMMTAISVALLVTVYYKRLGMLGKTVAATSFVAWVMLGVATVSLTSLITSVTICVVLIGEIIGKRKCYED
jgi:hypothetical protein